MRLSIHLPPVRALSVVVGIALLTCACGSKSGLTTGDRAAVVDSGSTPDGGFDTFPCSWSYGEPLDLGEAVPGATLGGAIHGRADIAWVQTGPAEPTGSGFSQLLALGDPPSLLETSPLAGAVPLHGLTDGWAALAPDCSLSFFDDEGTPLRLVLPPVNAPPCSFDRLDPRFIDVSARGMALRASSATRMSTRGAVVHDVSTSSAPFGDGHQAVVSAGGDLVARFVLGGGAFGTVVATVSRATGEVLWAADVGASDGRFAVSVDRLRDAAVVLLGAPGGGAVVRLPLTPAATPVQGLADIGVPILNLSTALVTNETEALVALADGRVAVQPLSGSELRFLPAPPDGEVVDLRVLLAPGQSRGGLVYRYRTAPGEDRVAFRSLTCNR